MITLQPNHGRSGYDLIDWAFRLIGMSNKDKTPDAVEIHNALQSLNGLLGTWSLDSSNIYRVDTEVWPLTDKNPVTWGIGGDWNSERPTRLVEAYLDHSGFREPLDIREAEDFIAINQTYQRIGAMEALYIDNGWPKARVYFDVNMQQNQSIVTVSEKPFAEFDSLERCATFPPGYERALAYNLAIELAPQMGAEIPKSVAINAATSLNAIKAKNTRVPTRDLVEPMGFGGFGSNWP